MAGKFKISNLLNFLPEGSSRATVDLAEAAAEAAVAELGSGARKGVSAEDDPLWWVLWRWWLPPAVVEWEEEVPPWPP